MNSALTLEDAALVFREEGLLDGALGFLSSRSRKSRELSLPAGDVFKGVAAALDQLVIPVIETRTAVEFNAAATAAFPKYMALTLALSRVAHAIVPSEVVERMTREFICELETDFRDKALSAFGATARDQAMFTIWTLRKINDLLIRITSLKLENFNVKEDRKFRSHFAIYALRGQFSLDCLNMALQLNRPIYPEVMTELIDGLRFMVNAYTWARRGLDLRLPQELPRLEAQVPDDDEDEYLLLESMNDLGS